MTIETSGGSSRCSGIWLGCVAVMLWIAPPAHAAGPPPTGITKLEITSHEPAFGGRTFGDVGGYELLRGRAYGALDPKRPEHRGMAFIDGAPLDAQGLVEYAMDVAILRPVEAMHGNGRLLYDAPDRGTPGILGQINHGSLTDPGNGFLMRQGYTLVWSAWQPDANPRTATFKASFPFATHFDAPITARVMEVYIPDTPETGAGGSQTIAGTVLTSSLTYPPVALDAATTDLALTVRENYDDPRRPLPATAARFVSDTGVQIDLSAGRALGMDDGAIYELVYEAKQPFVGGLGFASVRDLVSYLRTATKDNAGNDNPARPGGRALVAAYGWGFSQAGRFLKDFVTQGFNADLNHHRVFDGVHEVVTGARRTDHNSEFAQSSRWPRQHEEQNYPGTEFPFGYSTQYDPLTRQRGGILARCSTTATCPKVFHVDSEFEVWNGRLSQVVTDPQGRPADLPGEVRAYLMSGQSHSPGDGTPHGLPLCKLPSDPIDDSAVYRALIVAMDAWVTKQVTPPNSQYPSLHTGTLVTLDQAQAAWPKIPGFAFNRHMSGADLGDWTKAPPTFAPGYKLLVTKTDPATGNPTGGVIGADLAAPLGTYFGRNFRKPGHAEDELCGGNGGFLAFAHTKAERQANGDSRPSLEELYPNGEADFRARRLAQAKALAAQHLLLPDEVTSYAAIAAYPR